MSYMKIISLYFQFKMGKFDQKNNKPSRVTDITPVIIGHYNIFILKQLNIMFSYYLQFTSHIHS